MSHYDHPLFVWPFMAGVVFLAIWLPVIFTKWLKNTSYNHFRIILANLFSAKTLKAAGEVFRESLLHLRIFRFDKRLGYMHMSLAFGWFLLIVVGKFETMIFTHDGLNRFYLPIFLKYFYPDGFPHTFKGIFFLTLMDMLLLFVLTGLVMAFLKRFRSRMLGMKRTTKHILPDRLALTFLWFIFPCRWFAESVTAGIYDSGGFFTLASGKALASVLPLQPLFLPAWWAYSIALAGFFILLPFSRYMHIFTEVGLIFLKHWGLKTGDRENGYADFEIHACSRCGICTNVCQLPEDAGIHHSQAVYFLRDMRYDRPSAEILENCFLCGRCSGACPVDIGIDYLRMKQRKSEVNHTVSPYKWKPVDDPGEYGEVLYFAGCMSHLTPSVILATREILERAGIRHSMLDENGGICCGRPSMQAGYADQARAVIENTTRMILHSGAGMLLVSCPICYRVFREEYNLSIPVVHHSEYFNRLMKEKPAIFKSSGLRMSYHDPCDLGRGSGIYEQPREIIRRIGSLTGSDHEKANSLCCGGSLANLSITPDQRERITTAAYTHLTANKPDYLVTSCPLCKKTFSSGKPVIPVIDLSEAVRMSMVPDKAADSARKMKREREPAVTSPVP
jgi:Fe-S oxidoreductase